MKQDLKGICAILIFTMAMVSLVFACKDTMKNSMKEDQARLDLQLKEIQKMSVAEQAACQNASEWRFTAIGEKGCGGASGYITYPAKIDTIAFMNKVKAYTNEQHEFNKKWNVTSDCSLILAPKGITCENGKPKLVFNLKDKELNSRLRINKI